MKKHFNFENFKNFRKIEKFFHSEICIFFFKNAGLSCFEVWLPMHLEDFSAGFYEPKFEKVRCKSRTVSNFGPFFRCLTFSFHPRMCYCMPQWKFDTVQSVLDCVCSVQCVYKIGSACGIWGRKWEKEGRTQSDWPRYGQQRWQNVVWLNGDLLRSQSGMS